MSAMTDAKQRSRRQLVEDRKKAAEDVCWKTLLMMGLGELEMIPVEFRDVLAPEMQKWADLAHATGILGT